MSGLNLLNTNRNSGAFRPGYVPTNTADTIGAAFTNTRQNYNLDAEQRLVGDPLYKRNALFQERMGRSIMEATGVDKKYPAPSAEGRIQMMTEANELIDNIITQGRKENPSLYDGIQTSAEIRAAGQEKARQATENYEEISYRNPSGISRAAGSVVGGIGGSFTDPVNIATLPIGAGETRIVGTGGFAVAKGVAIAAAKEGAIQAAIQAASIPQVAEWQQQVGNKYGLSEAATDVAMGFVGGAGIRAGMEGIVPALRGVRRGSAHVSSYMLDQIAQKAPRLDQTVRDSLRYMSRAAYIDDSAPVPVMNQGDLAAHRANVAKVNKDLDNYSRPIAEEKAQENAAWFQESEALRQADLEQFAQEARHPKNGMSFFEALDEMASRPETVNDPVYHTPERQTLRENILGDLLSEPEGGYHAGRTIEIIMGPPGAGKSSVVAGRLKKELKAIEIDSDIVKERLPEFEGGIGANAVHEESKVISDAWLDIAMQKGWNIVHPIVGGNPKKVQALVDKMLSLGYNVNVRLVHIPANESLKRVIARFNSQGRLIPPSYVMGIGDGPIKTFDSLKQKDGINVYSYFDNNVKEGQEPKIVESNDPRFAAGNEAGSGIQLRKSRNKKTGPANDAVQEIDTAAADEFFDTNAYRLSEYRDKPMTPPSEIKPSDRFEASRAQFDTLVKEDPDMIIDLDDGTSVKLSDFASRLKEDQNVIDAITTCRLQ